MESAARVAGLYGNISMIEQIWKDQLSDGPFGQPLVAPEELEDVVKLMISSRINPQKFTGNLIALVGGA